MLNLLLNWFSWRTIRRARPGIVVFSLLGAVSSLRCASSDSGGPDAGSGGTEGGPRDQSEIEVGTDTNGDVSDGKKLNPLCGDEESGWCIPDDARACLDPEGMGGQGGSANIGGAAGGVNFSPGELGESGFACQVGFENNCGDAKCEIERSCVPSGVGAEGEPCVSAADCTAGLACVGEGLTGVCRPYCCYGTEASCNEDRFCDVRRLLEHPELYVPVCLPLDGCSLSEPYPCEEGRDCTCQGNRACLVVRADGATACTTPGAKQAGDECVGTGDCAHGFVCGTNQICMKICSTVSEDSGCPDGGTCLHKSALGSELGICIETTEASGG